MGRAVSTLLVLAATFGTPPPGAQAGQFTHVHYHNAGPHGEMPYHAVAARLTGSGNVDLALGDYLSGQVSILLGRGDGTFGKLLKFRVPAPIGIAAGDFNEDGIQDLAAVENNGTGDGTVAIFLGDGTGHFKLSASYAAGVAANQIAVADLNGDGHLDVAVTNFGFEGQGPSLMTFFGDGHGKLGHRATYKMPGQQPAGIAVGDLNGDGHPDLAVAAYQGESVAVFMNDGTGKFEAPVYYGVDGSPVDVKIADLRNDGRQDLVVADLGEGLDIWLNNGDGTFGEPATYRATFFGAEPPEACIAADLNLDGNLDVACAASEGYSYFFYGKGNGKFGPAHPIKETIEGYGGYSIAAADFNNDGAPDLAIPIEEYGKVAILLNTK